MDIVNDFINIGIEEDAYIKLPNDLKKEKGTYVLYKMKKLLYGLKKAPRRWSKCLPN